MLDLEAYLRRIGLRGRPNLAELHRAHATSIPFENLDPHRGVPISLDQADLERKLVAARRGGYCFEQNLLLRSALEALGAEVDLMLARVRAGASPGVVRPLSHLVLRVRSSEEGHWHADVGFGRGTLLEPIPFGPGGPYEQCGWRFRVVEEGRELVLQQHDGADWTDMYGFLPEPVPFADLEVGNWYTSAFPRSPFVTGLIVARVDPDGLRTTVSDWDGLELTESTPSQTTVTPLERAALPQLLATRFALPGFALDATGRVVLAGAWCPDSEVRPQLGGLG